jgi:hypothetical protein
MGERRARLALAFALDKTEMDVVSMGLIPEDMDDRWFVYFEDTRLHVHRSWTGYEIYEVRFEQEKGSHVARDVWVTRDPDRYRRDEGPEGEADDAKFLTELLGWTFGIEVRPGATD